MLKKILSLSLLAILAVAATAQSRLLSPDEFLPNKIGSQFTEHSQLVAYYQYVAANSDRVKLLEFGRTNELRPQILAIVSTPENLRRIEDIRLNNLRTAGILPGKPDNSNPIAIVWLGFSVHGNEAAGSEASMPVLYDLVDPDNPETSDWLKNTVVLLEPSVNPDGYSRYTAWYRQVSSAMPDIDPQAREHNEPWPGGRVNHYLFDLNRDWAWSTQVETQNRLKIFNSWQPQVVADLHEQYYENPYYFAPAAQPYHRFLTKWQADFQVEVGRNHAKYFDRNGWLYFTKEIFDLLYPSYGDTYPCFNGAIGMTYEQGGHSRCGRAIQLPNGDTLTLADRVAHHRTTALSTVEVSSKNAGRIVEHFADFYQKSKNSPPGDYKTYVVKSTNPAPKIKALMAQLDRNGIQYGRAGKATGGVDAYDYGTGLKGKSAVGEDDLVVSAYQPKGLLAQVLLDPEAEVVDSNTYDITAWSLLQAHGLDAFATAQHIEPKSLGYDFAPQSQSLPTDPAYAYLIRWNSVQSARLLSELLKQGIVCRYAEEPFKLKGEEWPAGTLVVTRADNRKHPGFAGAMAAACKKFDCSPGLAQTGFVDDGHDFGSETMHLVVAPKVLLLSGEKTQDNEFGQAWFFFDKEIGYPVTIVDAAELSGGLDLSSFNTLVMPEGNYGFDDATMLKIGNWVNSGGRVIAIGYANTAFADKPGYSLAKYARTTEGDQAKTEEERIALDHRTAVYKDRQRSSISDFNPGAVVRVKMDGSHPLAFGLKDYYFSLKTSSLRFDLLKNAWNVGYLEDDYRSNGFIGANVKAELKDSAVFAVQSKGSGKVIYLVDNPLFRAFWEEGKLLFSNAVFLVN